MTAHQSNLGIFCAVGSEIMRPQARHFGGEDLIRAFFGHFVPGST